MRRTMWLFVLAACGGGGSSGPADALIDTPADTNQGSGDAPRDAAADAAADAMGDAGPIAMMHHHYVLDSQQVPVNNTQARDMAFDLNNDSVVDNQFGMILGTVASMGDDVQGATTQSIDRGQIITLVDLAADDLTTGPHAGLTTYAGTSPSPAACAGANDTVCRGHLHGTATFAIAPTSATDALLPGTIAAGTLNAGPGHLSVPLGMFFGASPFTVKLIGARAKVTGITATGLTQLKIGGAIPMSEIDGTVYPAMRAGFQATVARDCTQLANPPACGCGANTTGKTLLSLFEVTHDCTITLQEVQSNSLMMSLFAPDVMVEGQMGLSYGFTATAVKATFTAP